MKVISALVVLAACGALSSACGSASTPGSTATPETAVETAAQPDLQNMLPDPSSYPAYLAAERSLVPGVFTMDTIATASAWNAFGVLVPKAAYQPAACTATRNPDVAPYLGQSFALDFYTFADQSKVSRPDQVVVVGATIARGSVDEAAVRALVEECGTVNADAVPTRFEVLPNPKVDPNQILAIRTIAGKAGGVVKLTYVAQVRGYTTTAYALCSKAPSCEKELAAVFRNGVDKALQS